VAIATGLARKINRPGWGGGGVCLPNFRRPASPLLLIARIKEKLNLRNATELLQAATRWADAQKG
jgi:hypothetical protein